MRLWWCNQGQCWGDERPAGLVCSAEAETDAGSKYRRTVADARKGDVIIHYVKSKIVAFSRARTDGGPCTVSLAAHYPFTPTHCWYGHNPDWYFETEYYDLAFPIPRDTFNQQLARLKTDAVLSNGNVR